MNGDSLPPGGGRPAYDDLPQVALELARERAGAGWSVLGPALQQALVCRELVVILVSVRDRRVDATAAACWAALHEIAPL